MKTLLPFSSRIVRSSPRPHVHLMLAMGGMLALGCPAWADALLPRPASAVTIADFEKFDETPMGVMFQSPFYSSTTAHHLSAANGVRVTEQFPSGHPRAEKKALLVSWSFKNDAVKPWLRLTTFNAPELPNPTIDGRARLRFDIYPSQALGVAVAVRETSTSAPLGADGGAEGSIEYVGVLAVDHGVPVCRQRLNAQEWTTVEIDLASENVVSFTGNDILDAGQGVLESLIFVGVNEDDHDFQVYLDNFAVVPSTPSLTSEATESLPAPSPVIPEVEAEDMPHACLVEAGNSSVLQWQAEANRRYHIFRKEISPGSAWINLGTEISFGDQSGSFTVFQPSDRAFYRVMETSSQQPVYLTQIPPAAEISSLRFQP